MKRQLVSRTVRPLARRLRLRLRSGRRKRVILALIAVRDERRFLRSFLENVSGSVDGIVAVDDQSSDGSGDVLARHPKVLEVITVAPGTLADNEDSVLRKLLVTAAWRYDPDWLFGIDADERLEVDFRSRAERELDIADEAGHDAMWVPFLELWTPTEVRVDGIWGQKRKACLFRSSRNHVFDDRRLHSIWASLPEPDQGWPVADLRLYHLRMIEPADRIARVDRYKSLDPDRELQAIGYDYLIDEEGIHLEPIEPGRHYLPAYAP